MFDLFSFSISPTFNAVGQVGPSQGPPQSPDAALPQLPIPWQSPPENPDALGLLSWHTRLSKFLGRDKEMQALERWAQAQPAVSIKFVTGEGGVGKSRLAAEFASKLQKPDWNWTAGFVDLRKAQAFTMRESGTLLAIDYPEEHRHGVDELLRDLARLGNKVRVRVLFLTRQPLDAWRDVIVDSGAAPITDMQAIKLGPLAADAAYEVFHSALERAAELLGSTPLPVSQEALEGWLEIAPENDRALFLVAAALHSAREPGDPVVTYSGRKVVDSLVERELSRLRKIATGAKLTDNLGLARLLALATLAGTVTTSRVQHLARDKSLLLGLPSESDAEGLLQSCGLLTNRALQALKPDIVAAGVTVAVLSKRPDAAPELIWSSLSEALQEGLERLIRLSYDAESVLGKAEYRLGNFLATAVRGNRERCEAIEPFISSKNPPALLPAAIEAWTTLLPTASEPSRRAQVLHNFAKDLGAARRREQALEAIEEAVELYRRLAAANPAAFDPQPGYEPQ